MHMHGDVGEPRRAWTLFYTWSPKADLNWCLSWFLGLSYILKYVMCMWEKVSREARRGLELEFWAVVPCLTWVLETELGFHVRTMCPWKCWAITPVLGIGLKVFLFDVVANHTNWTNTWFFQFCFSFLIIMSVDPLDEASWSQSTPLTSALKLPRKGSCPLSFLRSHENPKEVLHSVLLKEWVLFLGLLSF